MRFPELPLSCNYRRDKEVAYMLNYVRGIIAEKEINAVVVEACGLGYELVVPLSTYEKLPDIGVEVKIFTYHYVREDVEKLYGFFTKGEREIFQQLIGISKIGPKTAISILSGMSASDLVACVNMADSSRLRKIPGVGDKTAQRLVMELKGKLGSGMIADVESGSKAFKIAAGSPKSEAFDAMISLGYSEKQVQAALSRVESVIDNSAVAEEWIKKALQVI
jgi:holliday junction DNA helicase RuvA